MSSVGSRIRAARLAAGLSVDELAERLGKNRATVYRYESDDIENLPISIIAPLSTALQTTPAYLMGWESDVDECSKQFLKNLDEKYSVIDPDDFVGADEAMADYHFLGGLLEDPHSLSLEEAFRAADALGESLDEMLGKENPASMEGSEVVKEISYLSTLLSESQRNAALQYIRFLSENGEK